MKVQIIRPNYDSSQQRPEFNLSENWNKLSDTYAKLMRVTCDFNGYRSSVSLKITC